MTRSFQIAVEEHAAVDESPGGADEPFEFTFSDDPDTPLIIYPPTEGQIMLVMSLQGESMSQEAVSTVKSVIFAMLDDPSRAYVKRRLISRDQPLAFTDLMKVFFKIIEAYSGRPTESSPDSSASRATTGKSSTAPARRAASTRSPSRSTGSATSSTRGASRASKTAKSSTDS